MTVSELPLTAGVFLYSSALTIGLHSRMMCIKRNRERIRIANSGDMTLLNDHDPRSGPVLGTKAQRTYENCRPNRCSLPVSNENAAILAGKYAGYDNPVAHLNATDVVMLPLPLPLQLPKMMLKVPQLARHCASSKKGVAIATTTSPTACAATTRTAARREASVQSAPSAERSRLLARPSTVPSQQISGYTKASVFRTDNDIDILDATFKRLSVCGFYYGKLSMADAKRKLRRAAVGTYLLRDSSDPKFLNSLSVKTNRGTTSVRISYSLGQFRLDCDEALAHVVPSFDCVLKLVEYYTRGDSAGVDTGSVCVFLESSGRRDTPIELVRPHVETVCSLQALCRKRVNKTVPDAEQRGQLPVSDDVRRFLTEYPYPM